MYVKICCAALFFVVTSTFGQWYTALTVKPELSENADAVIRMDRYDLEITENQHVKWKVSQVITIYNKSGNDFVDDVLPYDKENKIGDYSAVVYSLLGAKEAEFKKRIGTIIVGQGVLIYIPITV